PTSSPVSGTRSIVRVLHGVVDPSPSLRMTLRAAWVPLPQVRGRKLRLKRRVGCNLRPLTRERVGEARGVALGVGLAAALTEHVALGGADEGARAGHVEPGHEMAEAPDDGDGSVA